MNNKFVILGGAAVMYLSIVWLQQPTAFIVFVAAPAVWVGLPAAILTTIVWLCQISCGRSGRRALAVLKFALLYVLIAGAGLLVNSWSYERDLRTDKAYVERITPALESYRREHGSYPTALENLPDASPVPVLLQSFDRYYSDGQLYRFSCLQLWMGRWDYSSKTGTWQTYFSP